MADDKNAPKLVRAIVANGRTVVAADPSRQDVVGYDPEGKPVRRARSVTFGPGQEVELSPDEVKQLRASGFLVDPDAVPPTVEGPRLLEGKRAA